MIGCWSCDQQQLLLHFDAIHVHVCVYCDTVKFQLLCPLSVDIDDLFSVSSELLPVAHKWKKIGHALRLDPNLLERIRQKNHVDADDYLSDVLTEWLKKAYNVVRFGDPSWKLLVEALAHPAGGNDCALAEKISRKVEGERAMVQRKRKRVGVERQMADMKRTRK